MIKKDVGMRTSSPTSHYYNQSSERLTFRSLTRDDIQAWQFFFNDEDYHRFLGPINNNSPKERAEFWINRQLERMEDKQFGQLAITLSTTGEFIGVGGIIEREVHGNKEFEITYSFLPKFWKNGFATESALHFIAYAEKYIETKSVISIIHEDNHPSINVALRNNLSFDQKTTFLEMPVSIYRIYFDESTGKQHN